MKIEVKIISEEIIKPSRETPHKLRHYTLSYLDQISPRMYIPLVLFYEPNNCGQAESEISEISRRMKKSLSDALALYYPLAGRVRTDRLVECNDEGIPFSEARVSSPKHLSELLNNPNPIEFLKLLPFDINRMNEFSAGIRLNTFSSGGGVAVGICVSHQLGDGISLIAFVKAWAALSRGGGGSAVEKPEFISAELFPPQDEPTLDPTLSINSKTAVIPSKMFSFAPLAIEALRAKHDGRISQIVALSVFILSRLLSCERGEVRRERVVIVDHPVNIRPKLDPPLPENSFGNLSRDAFTLLRGRDDIIMDGREIAKMIKEEIRKVDREFVAKMRESGEDPSLKRVVDEMTRVAKKGGEFLAFSFNSVCNFPLYDTDFGFGEPVWATGAALNYDNDVTFVDSKHRGGIEAYVSVKPEIMARLEADAEFIQYCQLYR